MNIVLQWPDKDPEEYLDYDIDWTRPMCTVSGDFILSSQWTLISGDVVIADSSFLVTRSKVWLSGGTVGTQSVLHNVVTTNAGRLMDRTVSINISDK